MGKSTISMAIFNSYGKFQMILGFLARLKRETVAAKTSESQRRWQQGKTPRIPSFSGTFESWDFAGAEMCQELWPFTSYNWL